MSPEWQGANLSFWLITILVLASGGVAAFSRSIVRAAYSLFFTLLGFAGYYVLLGSGFLAVAQVVIYVGGILVLLMFGILLTNRPLEIARRPDSIWLTAGTGLAGLLLMGVLLRVIMTTGLWTTDEPVPLETTVFALGRELAGEYLLAFELAGIALLLCLFGAAYLVRREERA